MNAIALGVAWFAVVVLVILTGRTYRRRQASR